MSLESAIYVVEWRLEDLADAMIVSLDAEAYGKGEAEVAGEHEHEAQLRAEKAVALHVDDPENCTDCLYRKMKWTTRAFRYGRIRERWQVWCKAAIGTVNIAPCTKDVGCRPGVMNDFVINALEVYDTTVLACDLDELDEFEEHAVQNKDATLRSARKALAAVDPQEDDATRQRLRDELCMLMLEHSRRIKVPKRFTECYDDPRIVEYVLDLIFGTDEGTGGDTDDGGHSSRKRACPDSPVADRHESARVKRVKQ